MKKCLLLVFLFLTAGHLMAADLVPDQTYRISLANAPKKSLFVENASLDKNAKIVLWTETNVNAQRWILTNRVDGDYILMNAYSGKYLASRGAIASGSEMCQTDLSTDAMACVFKKGNDPTTYYIQSESGLYIGGTNYEPDGSAIKLVSSSSSAYTWKVEAVDAQPNFLTETTRNEMMNGWKNIYYHENPGRIGEGGFWGDAEMFETVLDAYETTGEIQYKIMFDKLHADFIKRQGSNWESNDFNDDIAWIVIASIRAYLMTGTSSYLNVAKSNFDMMYERAAALPEGMLIWNAALNARGTNSCINGPAEVAACYLGIATGDETYFEKAKQMYAAQRKYLFKPFTGQVYDSFTWVGNTPSKYNTWASTYNQGTFLGAAVMLFNHYGDPQYKEDAQMIMKFTREQMCNEHGIIHSCQGVVDDKGKQVGDLPGFKGILVRYVRRYMVDLYHPELSDWLSSNAFHAYNNRNSDGVSSTAWLSKTVEEYTTSIPFSNYNKDPFGPSTAVSVAFNTYLEHKSVKKDPFTGVEAENFDYIKGAFTQDFGSSDTQVMLCGDKIANAYTGYHNVDFGHNYAKMIELNVLSQRSSSDIEIRLDGPEGELLATITPTYVSGANELATFSAELSRPLDGIRSIYLKYTRNSGAAKIIIDSFRFIKEGSTTQDITDNGGTITTSVIAAEENSAAQAVTDNSVVTAHAGTTTGDVWIQYQSPHPVLCKGYQLISAAGTAEGDPKSWKLQGSDDGKEWTTIDEQSNQLFASRLQKKAYNISTPKAYSYFRILVKERQGNDTRFQLAEWQLFGTALANNCITTDEGTLRAQYIDESSMILDRNATTSYQVPAPDFWLSYESPNKYRPSSYSLTSSDVEERDPKSWSLYASEDGINWVILDQRTNQSFPYRQSTYTYSIPSSSYSNKSYNHYKLHISANNGALETQFSEWQLFGEYTPHTFYNDITKNGGDLTSSSDGNTNSEALLKLTDNDGDTFYSFGSMETPWILYQSPLLVTVKDIALISADDPTKFPTEVLIEYKKAGAMNFSRLYKGAVKFSARKQRILLPLTRISTGTTFRVTVTEVADGSSGNNAELAEIELYGSGIIADDLTVGGRITAEFESTNEKEVSANTIDKKESSKFCGDFPMSSWVSCQLPNPIKVNMYSLTSAFGESDIGRDPCVWVMEASNDGFNWATIDSRENQKFSGRTTTQFYSCNKQEEAYSYYRINVTECLYNDKIQLSEWQLHYVPQLNVSVSTPAESLAKARLENNTLHIEIPEEAQVQLFSLSGVQIVAAKVQAGVTSLPVNGLSKGVYVVRIGLSTQTVSIKVIN